MPKQDYPKGHSHKNHRLGFFKSVFVLVPALKPGMVVIIDNARFHKSERIIEFIESAGCRGIFLPPDSPDFNPIEHYWSMIKKL